MSKNGHKANQEAEKNFFLALCGCLMFLVVVANLGSVSIYAEEKAPAERTTAQSKAPEILIDADSIIQLVFGQNPEVVATRYALQAAEFQFKDFVRNLSQFTPLLFRSDISRDQRQYEEGQVYSTRVGMEKEFFDGSSIFTGVGHGGNFGNPENGKGQFLETDVQFPLFGSNTTLRRITARSREENELLSARLEYVDTIRDNIRMAQYNYIDLLTHLERVAMRKECIEDYKGFLTISRAESDPVERQQIETAIQSAEADMIIYDEILNNILIMLRFSIGQEEISLSQVNSFDLYAKDYYGKSYLSRTVDELLAEANRNDINIRVLGNARKSSYEKKRLAEEGKWDVFVDFNAQYDINGDESLRDDNGYLVGFGLRITKIDPVLLSYSLSRAVAEINKYNALIRAQQLETKNQIDREWFMARNRRKQFEELFASIESQREVYLQKRKTYAEGKETIDNLIDSRKLIMLTQITLTHSLEGLYSSIVRLDHACGVYFTKLGIDLEGFYDEERIPGPKFSIPFE